MDLTKDILQVVEKVGLVPGLNAASSVVVSMIRTAETAKTNKTRLKSLIYMATSQLVSISESMQGKWDHAPHELKQRIDEFEANLRDALKVATKISKYSQLQALLTAGECEKIITSVEKRLGDVQRTITLSICISTAVALNQTHSGVERLVEEAERLRLEVDRSHAEPKSRMYTRDDIHLMHRVSHYTISGGRHDKNPVIVTLCRAKRVSDGRDVLVKKYEGSQPNTARQMFEKSLDIYSKAWDPAVLQFIGGSRLLSPSDLFQVFQTPSGHFELLWNWVQRTLRSNPVETIYGLYKLRTSVKDICDFQQSWSLKCSQMIWWGSVVSIQPHGNHLQFSLVYTHELQKLETRQDFDNIGYNYHYFFPDYMGFFMGMPSSGHEAEPAMMLAAAFCGASEIWFDDMHGLEALFKEGFETIDLLQLGSILFKCGWLGECDSFVPYGSSLTLGDVGYFSQDGNFEVVTNLHATFVLESGGFPKCVGNVAQDAFVNDIVFDGENIIELDDTCPGEVLFEYSGKRYKRHTPQSQPGSSGWRTAYTVFYSELNIGMAWRILQQRVSHIIDSYDLSIEPHQLQLVTNIFEHSSGTIRVPSEVTGIRTIQAQRESSSDMIGCPTIYRFEEGKGFFVGDSGALGFDKRVYYSFSPTPDGLDSDAQPEADSLGSDARHRHEDVRHEGSAGYTLTTRRSLRIRCLQLPPGVAHSSHVDHVS